MIPNNLRKFFNQLLTATNDGVVKWTEHDNFGRSYYSCSRNNFSVEISYFWDDAAELASITVSITTPDGSVGSFTTYQGETDYFDVRQLYELATISAASISPDSLEGFFD